MFLLKHPMEQNFRIQPHTPLLKTILKLAKFSYQFCGFYYTQILITCSFKSPTSVVLTIKYSLSEMKRSVLIDCFLMHFMNQFLKNYGMPKLYLFRLILLYFFRNSNNVLLILEARINEYLLNDVIYSPKIAHF